MQIEPQASAFAKRYAARRGAGGLDHAGRRPRNAGIGVPQDRRQPAAELPARIRRRRRGPRPLFDHRARARRDLALGRRQGRDRSQRARQDARDSRRARSRRSKSLRALVAESAIELPDALPPMAAGIFGYLGYDMVRLMEKLPSPNPDPIGLPDAVLVRPTIVVVFDAVKDTITVVTPVRPEKGVSAEGRAGARERAAFGRRRCARPAARSCRRQGERRLADGAAGLEHHAGRIRAHGAGRQGIHRRRRHLPGGAVAALRGAVRAAAVLALSRAAPGQPLPLSLLPRPRRVRHRRLEPGNPGEGERTARSPCARSPARVRAAPPRTRTRRWKPSCWPIRRSAPST